MTIDLSKSKMKTDPFYRVQRHFMRLMNPETLGYYAKVWMWVGLLFLADQAIRTSRSIEVRAVSPLIIFSGLFVLLEVGLRVAPEAHARFTRFATPGNTWLQTWVPLAFFANVVPMPNVIKDIEPMPLLGWLASIVLGAGSQVVLAAFLTKALVSVCCAHTDETVGGPRPAPELKLKSESTTIGDPEGSVRSTSTFFKSSELKVGMQQIGMQRARELRHDGYNPDTDTTTNMRTISTAFLGSLAANKSPFDESIANAETDALYDGSAFIADTRNCEGRCGRVAEILNLIESELANGYFNVAEALFDVLERDFRANPDVVALLDRERAAFEAAAARAAGTGPGFALISEGLELTDGSESPMTEELEVDLGDVYAAGQNTTRTASIGVPGRSASRTKSAFFQSEAGLQGTLAVDRPAVGGGAVMAAVGVGADARPLQLVSWFDVLRFHTNICLLSAVFSIFDEEREKVYVYLFQFSSAIVIYVACTTPAYRARLFGWMPPAAVMWLCQPAVLVSAGMILVTGFIGPWTFGCSTKKFIFRVASVRNGSIFNSDYFRALGPGGVLSLYLNGGFGSLAFPSSSAMRNIKISSLGVMIIGCAVSAICSFVLMIILSRFFVANESPVLALSMLTHTISIPVAVGAAPLICKGSVCASPAVAATTNILTGIFGLVVAPHMLTAFGIKDPVSRGIGIGTGGTAIGAIGLRNAGEITAAGIASLCVVMFTIFNFIMLLTPGFVELIGDLAIP